MRDSIERNYQARLADALPGTDTTSRAALLIAICAGVILDRMLLGHTELNSPGTENLIPYLRAALDAVAKVPEQGLRLARGCPRWSWGEGSCGRRDCVRDGGQGELRGRPGR